MPLRFILGMPGAGKTTRCLNEIESRFSNEAALYYLIPEQFSLQAEKLLLASRRSSVKTQALSFNRLAYRMFSKLGSPPGTLLDEAGKNMLLRKVMFECGEELIFYKNTADKQGFIDKLARTVTELNHYQVTAEDLRLRIPESNETLAAKLTDLSLILQRYREAVTGRYLLADDTLDLLFERLEDAGAGNFTPSPLNGTYFWVDGFTGFTPQEVRILSHIMQAAEQMTVTLTVRDAGADSQLTRSSQPASKEKNAPADSLFAPAWETYETLTQLARKLGVSIEPPVILDEDFRHANSPMLQWFTKHFSVTKSAAQPGTVQPQPVIHPTTHSFPPTISDASPSAVSPSLPSGISIVSAADSYAGVYEAARQIWEYVSQGCRFRDIAILCAERGKQEKILQTIFDRYKIPLFADTASGVLAHPLTELIRSSLEIINRDWQYESVMRFLKTRLTPISVDDTDRLENYILAQGIKSYRWRYPFSDEAEFLRQQLLSSMASFENLRPDSKSSVTDFCRRVTNLLYALNVPETLSGWYGARMAADDPDTARLHRQIWPKICEVLDKLAEILGEEQVAFRVFAKLLDAGLAQADLGRIPPTVDQVFLGDAGRSRYPNIKALIVIGANEGILPAPPMTDELLSDTERTLLQNTALRLAPDGSRQINESWYSLYNALCQPRENLTLIYSAGETSGRPLRPSPVIRRILAMFPQIEVKQAASIPEFAPIFSPKAPLYYRLSKRASRRLYGRTIITAASRLERYAECPFAYYIMYDLQARERKVYRIQPVDLGVLYHEVLAAFSLKMKDKNWGGLERPEISALVESCMEELLSDSGNVLHSSARNRHVLQKVKRICVTSVWALCRHVALGAFTPMAAEIAFSADEPGLNIKMPEVELESGQILKLTGRIDRVDVMRSEDGSDYLKIIDYKSGKTRFDLTEIMAGTQLQLILYMNALLKNAKLFLNPKPGGVFYFHLDDPVLPSDGPLEQERREVMLLECFKMSGLTLNGAAERIDSQLAERGKSVVIPVAINKDGGFSKASSVADLEFFEQLGKMVEEKIKELGTRMTEGVIDPEPHIKGKLSACDYCGYDTVCGYSVSM